MEDTYESCRKIEENINFKVDSYDLNCSVDFVVMALYLQLVPFKFVALVYC